MNSSVSLGKLYATILDVNEENINIDSKYLSLDSINEFAKQNLSTKEAEIKISKPFDFLFSSSWSEKKIQKIDLIQKKIQEKRDELSEFGRTIDDSTWSNLSIFEKANFVASNAYTLGAFYLMNNKAFLTLK